jgi:glycosyltransferase involved in cell wall biosynthesis
MSDSLVSVVIPTYNSAKTLPKCLESIKSQTCKNVEVIVVDNYSIDKTRDIAENFGVQLVLCKAGRSRARNVGACLAQGKFILSLDSDMELTPRVVEACLDIFKNNERIGGVIIPERSIGSSFWVKVRDFERSFYTNTDVESARFFRKDLVEKVNGFDEDIIFFEESTLPHKIESLGFNVKVRVSVEILHHENNFSLWRWLQKKFYYGKTARLYKKRYKNSASKQLNVSSRFLIFAGNKRFYLKPFLAFGIITLKLLECIAAGLGFMISMTTRGLRSVG